MSPHRGGIFVMVAEFSKKKLPENLQIENTFTYDKSLQPQLIKIKSLAVPLHTTLVQQW
jgi:hypothetical protein